MGLFRRMKKGKGLNCFIGHKENGESCYCDIGKASHILVSGCCGSGKSVFLHGVILSLIKSYTHNEIGLVLLDTKRQGEFAVYKGIPHLLGYDINLAVKELEARLSATHSCGTQKKIIVVIDEFAAIHNPQEQKTLEKLLKTGANYGIHVVMATQVGEKDVINSTIKECCSDVVCFLVLDEGVSRLVLGESGAEELSGKGDMLYRDRNGNIAHLQAEYVLVEETKKFVEKLKGIRP